MWPRNALLVVWLGISLGLAIAGSILGATIALCVVALEAYAAVTFARAAIRANAEGITYRAPLGRLRTFPRATLFRVVVGRPITGVVGRPPRIVFEAPDGAALVVLDPAMWAPADIARIANRIQIAIEEWPRPRPRSLVDHMLRFAAAALYDRCCSHNGNCAGVPLRITTYRYLDRKFKRAVLKSSQ